MEKMSDELVWRNSLMDALKKNGMSIEYISEEGKRLGAIADRKYATAKNETLDTYSSGMSENDLIDAQGYLRDDIDNNIFESAQEQYEVEGYDDVFTEYTLTTAELEMSDNPKAKDYLKDIEMLNEDMNNNRGKYIKEATFEMAKQDIINNTETNFRNRPEIFKEFYQESVKEISKKPNLIKNEKRKKEIKDLTLNATDKINQVSTNPKDVKEYLNFMSKFHNYSSKNQTLLNSQYDGANAVGSAKRWKDDHGFYIRKGQKALKIFAPTKYNVFKVNGQELTYTQLNKEMQAQAKSGKLDDKKSQVTGFKLVPVFDITQTTAKPEDYPKFYPNRPQQYNYNGKYLENLKQAMLTTTKNENISVREKETMTNASRGYYNPANKVIAMSDNSTDTEFVHTLSHELAHHKLHSNETDMSTGLKEVEAEMTAYVVSKHFGIDTEKQSMEYMKGWTKEMKDTESVEKSLGTIQKTSHSIIEGVTSELENGLKLSLDKKKKLQRSNDMER